MLPFAGHLPLTLWSEIMTNILQVDLPWLILRTKIVQEDQQGVLYRTLFDNYILDNSKIQMVIQQKFKFHAFSFFDFSRIQVLWKIYICEKICS